MLIEERLAKIQKIVNEQKSISMEALAEQVLRFKRYYSTRFNSFRKGRTFKENAWWRYLSAV